MKRIAACLAVSFAVGLLASQVAPGAQPGPARASKVKTVDINHFEFHPPTLSVPKGAKVLFFNSSGTAHTATDKGAFDSGRIKPGGSVAVRFEQKGTFRYHCEIHPTMHGKIVVG
ncbi:MAG TPA: cupredoxin domain-containing protein [Solirubrobacterales bacterium]|nr:cupredoxin domain-containing protein [Solirubrobacterales bacterium]